MVRKYTENQGPNAISVQEPVNGYKKGYLTLPNLVSWLHDRPFSYKNTQADDTENWSIAVAYQQPPSRVFEVSESLGKLSVEYAAVPSGPWDEGRISHRALVAIDPPESKTFGWYMRISSQFEDFLSLLVGHPVQSRLVRLYVEKDDVSPAHENALLYLPRHKIDQGRLSPPAMLITYPQVEQHFAKMLRSWMTYPIKIQNAINLLFSSIRELGAFLESRFLPIVQAAEVFARATTPNSKSMKLKKLLRTSIDSLDDQTVSLFCKDRDDFIRTVVDTRNYFTHYDDRFDKILQGIEIHWATVKLTILLKILLLKLSGMPEDELSDIILKNHQMSLERRGWRAVSETGSPVDKGALNA